MDTREVQKHLRSLIEQMTQLADSLSSESETAEMQKAKDRVDKNLCCYCGEPHGDDIIYRGDHQKCYKRVWRVIHSKELSEEQAVRRGWMLPADTGGRKVDPNDPIAIFMAEKATTTKPRKKQSKGD